MTDKEKQFKEIFEKVWESLTEEEKQKLLWLGEGMAIKVQLMSQTTKAS